MLWKQIPVYNTTISLTNENQMHKFMKFTALDTSITTHANCAIMYQNICDWNLMNPSMTCLILESSAQMFYSSTIVFTQFSPQLQALEHFKDRRTQVHLCGPHARSVEQPQYASCTQDAETGSSVVSVSFRVQS